MPNVPSVVTSSSASLVQARKRTISLYRDWLRAAPVVVKTYRLDIPTSQVRERIRQEFVKNRHIADKSVIDVLLFKGRIEYEETLNMWKQSSHVMRYFQEPEATKSNAFLDRFFEGRA
ncbi:NADH dehydrogenase, alpha subcomplex, subunit 6 [Polychytrium aggregatum]|uniref:NADH dehydrogenase, alpha subcomplex, subunit 6 n=1 Tax=Polychytrium aggregatum TaxID=110093 RepID=UPI0022FF0C58|nr:NADH dehydrogenase, alpha subcomplex, subunit 6 [Polychytrium aggregatum]KAI9203008.1 NADH dehydrogenase, alpha subcomplex, subunit 6 [Polychytrium aggregatum]